MTALDLDAVRGYAKDLEDQIRRCDNGEGMFCSDLDGRIDHYVELCQNLRSYISRWARAVFEGRIGFDREVEDAFQSQIQLLLRRSDEVAAHGRQMDGMCFTLEGLNPLHHQIASLYYLRDHWVSPRRAIGPAPRVELAHAAAQEIAERLESLEPLPADWHPSDPLQDIYFQHKRAK